MCCGGGGGMYMFMCGVVCGEACGMRACGCRSMCGGEEMLAAVRTHLR